MAAPKAPLLDSAGKKSKDVTLEEAVFAADVKPHLVHEAVRAELNAQRAGPVVLVATEDETNLIKSFRNLERVAIVAPGELEVSAVVWARSLLVSEAALPLVQGRAQS